MRRAERLRFGRIYVVAKCARVHAEVHSVLSLIVSWEVARCDECLMIISAVVLIISAKKTLVTSLLFNLFDRVSLEYLLTRNAFVSQLVCVIINDVRLQEADY